jgi:5S rRNA maturation endonuclease (ribonuclease M5)
MRTEKFRERKELEGIVSRIDRDVDAVVVEGFSDRKVLRGLGMESRMFECAERAVEDLTEDLERAVDRVAILTDFDSHGEEENQELVHELQGRVDVIQSARRSLESAFREEGRMAIEDAAPLLKSKEKKFEDALADRLFMRSE